MMKNSDYKFKIERGKFIEGLKSFVRIFKRKPQIENLSGEELPQKAVYLSNHAGAHGAMIYELYFPKRVTPWGTHEMCGNFKQRWNYLYHVFYRQKLHWGKLKAFVVATIFAPFSILFYRAVGLIATYKDLRFVGTLKTSCRVLDKDSSIIIYPENSSQGYLDPPPSFHSGFVQLCKMYKKLRNQDLPVYVCYCHAKKRKIVIDKPMFINQLLEEGKDEKEIAQIALERCQNLYYNHVLAESPTPRQKNKQQKSER